MIGLYKQFMKLKNQFLLVGILGALAVIFGAFGAHFLKERLSEKLLSTFQTGVQYHFYHTLAMLGVIAIGHRLKASNLKLCLGLFLAGIICFSGSLYLLSCREIIGLTVYRWLGPITPIGGLFFIGGWLCLAFGFQKEDT